MVAATTFLTCAACASLVIRVSRRWMATGGGKHLRSTPTKTWFSAVTRENTLYLKDTQLSFVRRLRQIPVVLVRGWGASNLYSLGEGQRAGPTARKVPESNKVLTLRASSAVPVRGEIPLSVARFSCALSVRIWVSQGRTGEGNKLGASHPVFWIPPWQVFACLELTNWFPKRRNHDRSNGAKNTAMA